MRLAAFAVALAWASVAYAEPPPPVGWKGVLDEARIICMSPDQIAIFIEGHNNPDGPVNIQAAHLLTDPPAKCAVAEMKGEVTTTGIVRLPNWDIGKGFSWGAYAIEVATDKPFAWVLYLDANRLLGI